MDFNQKNRLQILEYLVEELMKDEVEESFVKECMEHIGLTYSEDPIECINLVLSEMHTRSAARPEVINEERR